MTDTTKPIIQQNVNRPTKKDFPEAANLTKDIVLSIYNSIRTQGNCTGFCDNKEFLECVDWIFENIKRFNGELEEWIAKKESIMNGKLPSQEIYESVKRLFNTKRVVKNFYEITNPIENRNEIYDVKLGLNLSPRWVRFARKNELLGEISISINVRGTSWKDFAEIKSEGTKKDGLTRLFEMRREDLRFMSSYLKCIIYHYVLRIYMKGASNVYPQVEFVKMDGYYHATAKEKETIEKWHEIKIGDMTVSTIQYTEDYTNILQLLLEDITEWRAKITGEKEPEITVPTVLEEPIPVKETIVPKQAVPKIDETPVVVPLLREVPVTQTSQIPSNPVKIEQKQVISETTKPVEGFVTQSQVISSSTDFNKLIDDTKPVAPEKRPAPVILQQQTTSVPVVVEQQGTVNQNIGQVGKLDSQVAQPVQIVQKIELGNVQKIEPGNVQPQQNEPRSVLTGRSQKTQEPVVDKKIEPRNVHTQQSQGLNIEIGNVSTGGSQKTQEPVVVQEIERRNVQPQPQPQSLENRNVNAKLPLPPPSIVSSPGSVSNKRESDVMEYEDSLIVQIMNSTAKIERAMQLMEIIDGKKKLAENPRKIDEKKWFQESSPSKKTTGAFITIPNEKTYLMLKSASQEVFGFVETVLNNQHSKTFANDTFLRRKLEKIRTGI